MTALGQERAEKPADDLVSALVTANIDGEQLTTAELASFFILLVVAKQRPQGTRCPMPWSCSPTSLSSGNCCSPM